MAERGNIEIKVGTTSTSFDEAKTAIINFFKEQFRLVRPVKKQTVHAYNARGDETSCVTTLCKEGEWLPIRTEPADGGILKRGTELSHQARLQGAKRG